MNSEPIPKNDLFNNLPKEWPQDLLPGIQRQIQEGSQKIVALDDDPTGTQTVHDIPVLTQWSIDALETELQTRHPAFYILTNSRSIPTFEACQLNREIEANLKTASQRAGIRVEVISRSDSTLRAATFRTKSMPCQKHLAPATAPISSYPAFLKASAIP